MNYTIDSRCRNVMLALQKSNDYITIKALSQELGQSRRNTQYDIYKLNGIFDLIRIPHIESRRNKGVRLLPTHVEWWRDLRKGEECFNYVYTQEERIAFLICKTIFSDKPDDMRTIERFSEALSVNRSTIIWDMRAARERLADYKVSLNFTSQNGYSVTGDELARRSVFMYCISLLYPLIRDGILTDFTGEQYESNLRKLRRIENELNIHFQEGTLDKIAMICQHLRSDSNTVVILGAGPIGIMAARWCRIFGAGRVVLVDIVDEKIKFATERGFEIINSAKEDCPARIREITGGRGADVVLEGTGTSNGLNTAIECVRAFGHISLFGNPHKDTTIQLASHSNILRKEIEIRGVWNSYYLDTPVNEWKFTVDMIDQNKLEVADLISHRSSLKDLKHLFDQIYHREITICKAIYSAALN